MQPARRLRPTGRRHTVVRAVFRFQEWEWSRIRAGPGSHTQMQPLRLHCRARRSLIGILLVAVLARGLIPAGYMPAYAGSLGLQLCNAGLTHHSSHDSDPRSGRAPHLEHCVFGNAPLAGPTPHGVIALPPAAPPSDSTFVTKPLQVSARIHRTQQPRAPPLPA